MSILVLTHSSQVLGVLHLCQCSYCATKAPDPCGVTEDGCTSDFTPLTAQELLDNAVLIV